jgi:hypothetical protein
MQHHWRRLALLVTAVLLTVFLIGLGVAVWLYKSGRLASLSQDLLQRLSGQNVTFETVEFPSWHTVVFTNLRLQQRFPHWRLVVECPRLEVHYTLAGLFNKQVDHLYLRQPRAELSRSDDTSPPAQAPSPPAVTVLPLKRLTIQQGTLHLRLGDQTHTLQQFEATLRLYGNRQLQAEASGSLGDGATTLQAVARIALGKPQPSGKVHLSVNAVPLARLAETVSQALPPVWKAIQGTLDVETELEFQDPTLRGRVTTTMRQVTAQSQGAAIHQATLSTQATLEVNYTQRTLQAQGQLTLQAEQARRAPNLMASTIALTTPWRLSYTPDRWQITATPALQSQTAEIGSLVRASRLSLTMPVRVRHNSHGLQIQGTPEIAVQTIRLVVGGQPGTTLRITGLHGRLSLHGSVTKLDIAEALLQTQTWQWQTAKGTRLLPALRLQGSSSLDLRRQRVMLRDVTVTLPQLGRITGTGEWHWPSHTLQDLQVQFAPRTIDALWKHLKVLLPAPYRAWHAAGHTNLRLRAKRLSLRPPRHLQSLAVVWQVRDGAFSSPDSTYASEHLTGTLQATAALDETAGQYTLQGTLTLQPLALLIGSVFPALEENRLTSAVTFSGIYSAATERLQIYLAGQFRDLGTLTLQGRVHRPFAVPQYNVQLHLRNLRVSQFWKIFVHDAVGFPSLSQAKAQGTLNAIVRLRGQPTNLLLQGTLDVTGGHFHTGSVVVHGVSLLLPLQMRYPLPPAAPEGVTPPREVFGRLNIDTLQIGNVEVGHLTIRLALWSDSVFVQRGVHLSLWGGDITLEDITARHIFQPRRRLAFRARLRNLDLQRLPRGATKLPLAGMVNGDSPLLQIRGDRLETQGSLTIAIAGGTIRLFNLQGSHLFSGLPTLRCSLTTERPLSLLRLTDIYPIGDIGGTMRFTVTNLTLTAGELAAFSLEFAVQEKGGEKREITLRALNNLLFTTGSAKVASGLLGETYRLPYKRFGAEVTLRNDTLRLRGKYHDSEGKEYFMQAPALGGGVSIINRVPENGIPFRDFLQRLRATVLERPDVQVK